MKEILKTKNQIYEYAAKNNAHDSIEFYKITKEQIDALLEGKIVITDNGEYTFVLQLKEE